MKLTLFIFVGLLIIGISAWDISPIQAADATVTDCTNFAGAGTISNAVTSANAGGGTITFNCSGTITFSSVLSITANVVINADGTTVIFDGGGTTNLFDVIAGASLTLNGFTLQNGNALVGGAIYNDGALTITNSIFSNNSVINFGGAIHNDSSATLIVTDTLFSDNSATQYAGAISNFGVVTINQSTLTNNSAIESGGAIYTFNGTMTITNSVFTSNSSNLTSGAIFSANGTTTITNSLFAGNSAVNGGAISNTDLMTITDTTFTSNSVTIDGGAIYNDPTGTLTVIASTFRGNSAGNRGGAIFNNGVASKQDSHYENNTCFSFGTLTDNGGNTFINATDCPGTAPIALSVSALACNGDNAVLTINAGDANFNITGTGAGLDILDSPAGLITLPGPATWMDVTVTERRGEREFVPLGGISCPEGVIIPPSEPVAPIVTVLGCALDTADGVEVANAPDDTYCRVLMKNGGVVSYSGAIPAQLINLGVILAVDVYRLEGGRSISEFPNYARVCLAGQGRLFYMDSRNAPRVSIELASENVDGLTCGWIPAPGTLILTN